MARQPLARVALVVGRKALGAQRDGLIHPNPLSEDGRLANHDTRAVIDEEARTDPGAGMNVDAGVGVRLLGDDAGEQRQECAVRVRHAEPNGQSHQLWRAVAADTSVASLAAAVEVARHAQKTDGEQSLRGLLLDRTATINLKPELEIFADDVKCAHGAAVGDLEAEQLFYLRARGLPEAEARNLLIRAFLEDAVLEIADEAIRAEVWREVETALERLA